LKIEAHIMNFAFWQVFWVAETYTFLSWCDWLGYSFHLIVLPMLPCVLCSVGVSWTQPGGRGCHLTACLTLENLWTNVGIRY